MNIQKKFYNLLEFIVVLNNCSVSIDGSSQKSCFGPIINIDDGAQKSCFNLAVFLALMVMLNSHDGPDVLEPKDL